MWLCVLDADAHAGAHADSYAYNNVVGIESDPAKRRGCGLLYHLWQGGNRPIRNDSRCLNTMSIFDGKDGSSHPSFSKQTFLLVPFSF